MRIRFLLPTISVFLWSALTPFPVFLIDLFLVGVFSSSILVIWRHILNLFSSFLFYLRSLVALLFFHFTFSMIEKFITPCRFSSASLFVSGLLSSYLGCCDLLYTPSFRPCWFRLCATTFLACFMSTLQSFFLWVQLGQLSITVVPASEVCVYRSIDPVLLFPAGPAMPLAGPSLRPDHGLPSSVVLGASLADSDSPLVNASVSENLPARSLVASDRFSVATSGSDQIISSSPTFPLVDSDLSEIFFFVLLFV